MLQREWRISLVWIIPVSQSTALGLQVSAPRTEPAPAAREQPQTDDNADIQRRKETFEIVWRTVKEYHYDPSFGGVDWDRVKEEFAPTLIKGDNKRHTRERFSSQSWRSTTLEAI